MTHGPDLTPGEIVAWLGGGDAIREWVTWLDGVEVPGPAAVPTGAALVETLVHFSVTHEDIETLVALRPALDADPRVRWLLDRSVAAVVARMGVVAPWVRIPPMPEALGPLRRWLFVYVFAAALPAVRAFHHERDIPDDVSWATLADLGRQMAVHRKREGESGFDDPVWVALHCSGAIYQLGRLQFERIHLGNTSGRAIHDQGAGDGPGTPALSVHIPGYFGPFTPAECDESFARARAFFARHFPEERYDIAICHSWLLDEQLAEYLPATSNIVRFQRRFTPIAPQPDDDAMTLRFVFGLRTDLPLEAYPQRSTLERAVIGHIRAGRHWHGGAGWVRL